MIKEKIIETRNKFKDLRSFRVTLGTVLGEFDRISKTPTDEQCIQVIKKMMESNELTHNNHENELLRTFLPKQLNKEDIIVIISNNNFKSIGKCMRYFKSNHSGQYDGKLVANLFKEWNESK